MSFLGGLIRHSLDTLTVMRLIDRGSVIGHVFWTCCDLWRIVLTVVVGNYLGYSTLFLGSNPLWLYLC